VFVEKPLALTLDHAEHLVLLAAERQRILMVGHVLEYHPAIEKLVEMHRACEFGKLQYLYSRRLSLGRLRQDENVLWSFAPHDVAIILRLTGSLPSSVMAHGCSVLRPGAPDVTVTSMQFGSGAGAHIHVSWLNPFKEQRFVLVGSRKMAAYDDVDKTLLVYDKRGEVDHDGVATVVNGSAEVVDVSGQEPLKRECQAFLRAVQSRTQPKADGQSGLAVLRVLDAAQRSIDQERNLQLVEGIYQ
jgi:predicted dehydrogenase